MILQRSSMKRRHMATVPGIRVYTKDTMGTSLTTTYKEKAVDTKVEIPIKVKDIKDVAIVVAVVTTIEAMVVAEEAKGGHTNSRSISY